LGRTGPFRIPPSECPYMDSPSFANKLLWQAWHDCIRISGLLSRHALMPGHNGLFARQRPIALPYFEYVDIPGFSRRRSYLFAIIQLA
jgi:hypothetical protein